METTPQSFLIEFSDKPLFTITAGAAMFGLPVAFLLIWLYKLAVNRSMRRVTGISDSDFSRALATGSAAGGPQSQLAIARLDGHTAASAAASALGRGALNGSWRNAMIYANAGLAFSIIISLGYLVALGDATSLHTFLFLFVNNSWPILVSMGIARSYTWRGWSAIAAAYFLLFLVQFAIAVLTKTAIWSSVRLGASDLMVINMTAIIFSLCFLSRGLRAAGPLVYLLMLALLGGLTLMSTVLESRFGEDAGSQSQWFATFSEPYGLSGRTVAVTLNLSVLAVFGIVGWIVMRGLGGLYRRGWVSDQTLTIDAVWLLSASFHSIVLSSLGWRVSLIVPLAAFLAYKVIATAGFAALLPGSRSAADAPTLLLLRVFKLGRNSRNFFHAFAEPWRFAGNLRLIAGPDLATTTVEPHEFLEFLSGRLSRRFIADPEDLAQRLSEAAPRRDFDGRYRVADFFCHDDTWKLVLDRLAQDSDVVLMDLRGFGPENKGCIYEISTLLATVPLQRIILVVNQQTDDAFLRQTLATSWAAVPAGASNRSTANPNIRLFPLSRRRDVAGLVQAVASAATS